MKTQDRQMAIPRLVAVGLLVGMMSGLVACTWSDPCEKPDRTCTGQPSENATRFDFDMVNPQGCGEKKTCIWAHDEDEAKQCVETDPASWQVSPSSLTRHVVAACDNTTRCCEEWLNVLAGSPDDAQRCQTPAGWNPTDPATVFVHKERCTCKGTGSVGDTPFEVDLLNESELRVVSVRSQNDAETCIRKTIEATDTRVRDQDLFVSCDCRLEQRLDV